jgi:large subunit ribosomal protein L3
MSPVGTLLGRKLGMTQIFDASGSALGVTVIEVGPCPVLQVKTPETDGYHAIKVGFGAAKEKNVTKPMQGIFKKAGANVCRWTREVRLEQAAEQKVGDLIKVDEFNGVEKVDVTGITLGKGFAGGMKRWNFRGQPASHGCSKRHRAPGGLGRQGSVNKGVPKGKRMAGHLGSEQVTVIGLKVVHLDPEKNLLLVKGAVPGHKEALLLVRKSLKEKVRADREARKK